MKYFKNLKKDVQDFRTHNYKTLLKKKEAKLNEVIYHAYLLENSYCWFQIPHSTSAAGLVIIVKKKKKWPVNSKLYKEYQKAMNIEENLKKGNAVRFTYQISKLV